MPDFMVDLYNKIGIKLKRIKIQDSPTAKPIQDIVDKIKNMNNTDTDKNKNSKQKVIPLTSDTLMPYPSGIPSVVPAANTTPSSIQSSALPLTSTGNAGPPSKNEQVFHVKGDFDYSMSRAICKSYGAQLATYDQIDKAHKKGAEWCDYGWSEDGMVLYPTQRKSWEIYQQSDVPQKCGIPGVNGGYNNDLLQKLGANCYGKKPDGKAPPFSYPPKKKVKTPEYEVSPFNYSKWKI